MRRVAGSANGWSSSSCRGSTCPCGDTIGRSRTRAYSRRAMRRTPGSAGSSRSGCRVRVSPEAGMPLIVDGARGPGQPVAMCCLHALSRRVRRAHGGAMTGTLDVPTPARTAARIGGPEATLTAAEVDAFVREQLGDADLDGRSVCVLVPDGTRSCPLPLLLRAVHGALVGRATRITVLVALGTHQAMSEEHLARHLGYRSGELAATYPGLRVLNHEWWDPEALVSLGSIPAARLGALSGGRLQRDVEVRLNRAVVEHDVALVVGPVFPHEVVGFSGGNKYFFPGGAGQEIIDLSRWLGALITSADISGTRGITPGRALIDEAAALIPAETLALCVVAQSGSDDLYAAAFGAPESAWAACAEVSAETHVKYLDAPVRR